MIKKIAAGYKKLFSSAAKIILLAALCVAQAFVFVWPLWKWAMTSPVSYSWFLIVILSAALLWLICKSVRKNGFYSFLITELKILIVAGGIAGCIVLVLKGHRLVSLFVFFATFIVYGIVAFGIKNKKTQEKN